MYQYIMYTANHQMPLNIFLKDDLWFISPCNRSMIQQPSANGLRLRLTSRIKPLRTSLVNNCETDIGPIYFSHSAQDSTCCVTIGFDYIIILLQQQTYCMTNNRFMSTWVVVHIPFPHLHIVIGPDGICFYLKTKICLFFFYVRIYYYYDSHKEAFGVLYSKIKED